MITIGIWVKGRFISMDVEKGLDDEILKQWSSAIWNSCYGGSSEALKRFKEEHYEEYRLISAMYRKRVAIKQSLDIMEDLNEPIYWFTLTFNNDKDANSVETKRKEAQSFLNRLAMVYLMVEEYGEDNGRYHIHGFLCFRYGYGFLDFKDWHSRQKIELLEEDKIKKRKVRYLTKYAVKSVPRIRRSKTLSKLQDYYNKHKRFRSLFRETYNNDFKRVVDSVINPF